MSLQIVIFALVAIAAGGGMYALAYPLVAGGGRAEERQKAVTGIHPAARLQMRGRDATARRAQITESLKELEARQKRRRTPPLAVRIEQAGLKWSKQKYYVISVVLGVLSAMIMMMLTGKPIFTLAALFVGTLGLPLWILKFLTNRRQNKFLNEFPNAIDIIVRGVKAGLPLGDSMRAVAQDSQEPVKTEFRMILDTQAVGMPLQEAVLRLYDRMGLPEANFFGIVIAIQQKSGGSLSDALANLSKVLRDRRKMKAKIKAMSMEAKASATIIGSLPIGVGGLVYVTSPAYISLLWTTSTGMFVLGFSAFWMMVGILVMRKMINFDF